MPDEVPPRKLRSTASQAAKYRLAGDEVPPRQKNTLHFMQRHSVLYKKC